MRVKASQISMFLVFLAVIIPSYWFFNGMKIINMIYYLAAIFFVLYASRYIINNGLKRVMFSSIFLFSLFFYSAQALFDSGLTTAINEVVSSLVVVLIAKYAVKQEREFYSYLDGLICFAIPLLVFGILESIMTVNIFQSSSLTYESAYFYSEYRLGLLRISSVFGHPIVYCNYLSIICGLCVYRLSCDLTTQKRRMIIAVYILSMINALLTVSRSLMLVLIAEQIVLYAIKEKKVLSSNKGIFAMILIIGLVFCDIIGFKFMDSLEDMVNMLLQVFGLGSSEYSTTFSSEGYSGIAGDRWLLYSWVVISLGPNIWFGNGTNAAFSYLATEYRIKNSIENYYLSTFYKHGVVGLVIMVLGLIALAIYCKNTEKKNKQNKYSMIHENKLTFNATMLCLLFGELIAYFMVNQSGEVRLLYICYGLLFAYNSIVNKKNAPTYE